MDVVQSLVQQQRDNLGPIANVGPSTMIEHDMFTAGISSGVPDQDTPALRFAANQPAPSSENTYIRRRLSDGNALTGGTPHAERSSAYLILKHKWSNPVV